MRPCTVQFWQSILQQRTGLTTTRQNCRFRLGPAWSPCDCSKMRGRRRWRCPQWYSRWRRGGRHQCCRRLLCWRWCVRYRRRSRRREWWSWVFSETIRRGWAVGGACCSWWLSWCRWGSLEASGWWEKVRNRYLYEALKYTTFFYLVFTIFYKAT